MAGAMAIAGTVGWCVLLTGMPATAVVFWRCAFGALALASICMALPQQGGPRISLARPVWPPWRSVALGASWALLFAAYAHASIAIATVSYHIQPFMLAALGALFLPRKNDGLPGGMAGPGIRGARADRPRRHGGVRPALAGLPGRLGLALAAAFFYAVAAALTKTMPECRPGVIALIQLGVGAVLLLPFASAPAGASAPARVGLWW